MNEYVTRWTLAAIVLGLVALVAPGFGFALIYLFLAVGWAIYDRANLVRERPRNGSLW